MTTAPIRLADYQVPAFLIEDVHLTFRLAPNATRVVSRIRFRRNPEGKGDLRLDGEKLGLIAASIDGQQLLETDYHLTQHHMTIKGDRLPDAFTFGAEVEVDPENNTSLSGLYMSKGMYCTQCEAEGFRRITFYLDRPDVMATFTVRIEGEMPVLLSNGNPTASGDAGPNGMIPGPNLPICLRWWRVILWLLRTALPRPRGGRLTLRFGSDPGTRINVPMRWIP